MAKPQRRQAQSDDQVEGTAPEQADEEDGIDTRDVFDKIADLLPMVGAALGGGVVARVTRKRARYFQSKVEGGQTRIHNAKKNFEKTIQGGDQKKVPNAKSNLDKSLDLYDDAVRKRNAHRIVRGGQIIGGTGAGGYTGYVGRDIVQDKKRKRK